MATTYFDLGCYFTATTGGGTISLGSVMPGYNSLGSSQNGKTFNVVLRDGTAWEHSRGVYNHAAGTLTRNLVKSSTGSLLNLSGNAVRVAVGDIAASDFQAMLDRITTLENTVTSKVNSSAFNTFLINNTNDLVSIVTRLDDLEAKPVAVGAVGLQLQRASATELTIQTGSIHNHDLSARLTVETDITLDLTESGDLVNGSLRATNSWYYVLLGHAAGNIVAGLSNSLGKPASWSDWQIVGAMRTNASSGGQWDLFQQRGAWFFYEGEMFALSTNVNDTSETTARVWAPPLSVQAKMLFRTLTAANYTWAYIRSVSGGTNIVSIHTRQGANEYVEFDIVTNNDGNIFLQCDVASTWDALQLISRGFQCPIGEAGHV
ncbi:hypothetical protein AB1L30_05305 [Bremerella sp. JC817]|uniref:hypothetical protein n=1 Tax=Bremerella sp. JC817 TaxID=3231756 RepID=UPI0034575A6A